MEAKKNLAAEIRIDIGNVDKGFADADRIFEADYTVPKVQQVRKDQWVPWHPSHRWGRLDLEFPGGQLLRSIQSGRWVQRVLVIPVDR